MPLLAYANRVDPRAVVNQRVVHPCRHTEFALEHILANHVAVPMNILALILADMKLFKAGTPYQLPAVTHRQVQQVKEDLVVFSPRRPLAQSILLSGRGLTSKQA